MKTTKLIGRGAFTRAYLMENGRVLLKSCCPIKEIMALGWFPAHRLFPTLERVDHEVYEMDYYPRTSGLKRHMREQDWGWYQTLRRLWAAPTGCANDSYQAWYDAFSSIQDGELREVMLEALDAAGNMGPDVAFEISPRNVGVHNRRLVLLDCFYSIGKLREVRDARR